MMQNILLIIVFLVCAGVMKLFVKLVDRFIEDTIIADEMPEEVRRVEEIRIQAGGKQGTVQKIRIHTGEEQETAQESMSDMREHLQDTQGRLSDAQEKVADVKGNLADAPENRTDVRMMEQDRSSQGEENNKLRANDEKEGLLDKLRQKSKVMHKNLSDNVEIGTARPTQIRIHHYEQP